MIKLRKAQDIDAKLIFNWRNDERVRRHFFDPQELSLDNHMVWFSRMLNNPSISLFIILNEIDNTEVGCLRFDLLKEGAEIDIYLDPNHTGKGYATLALEVGIKHIKTNNKYIKHLIAKVLPENESSIKLFTRSRFQLKHHVFTLDILEEEE